MGVKAMFMANSIPGTLKELEILALLVAFVIWTLGLKRN